MPKRDSLERRIILDLSHPARNAINDFISKDFYLGDKVNLTFPRVDGLVNFIKIKGKGCMIFKKDLKRAYRQIPIDPGDASLVGQSWNGELYFDTVLSMGLRSAAHICQRVTNAVSYICSILNILVLNYLDDFAGAETRDKATKSYNELESVLLNCGLEESPEKASPPGTEMVFLGIGFNSYFEHHSGKIKGDTHSCGRVVVKTISYFERLTIFNRQTKFCSCLCAPR